MEPERKPIPQGLVARVAQGMRYIIGGKTPGAWMGPAEPMQPQAQEAKGRNFSYPVGYNIHYQPRGGEAVSFEQLRALADNYDLLRLVLETRKDQIAALDWTIQPRDKKAKPGAKAAKITDFLRFPDKEHDWSTWTRLIVEEMLVVDALTIYPRPNRGGGVYALEVFDGATIKRLIDSDGRTPIAPAPAYQQILHGVPAVDYTREELIYWQRNPRAHRIYAMSPVEQIIMTVNLALRRQLSQLEYYTEGSIPDAIAGVPPDWNAAKIAEFQGLFDQMLAGDTAARRRVTFVPGELKWQKTGEPLIKDEFDEWLARIVCFAFSIPPTPFIKQINRSMAEQAQATALQEGLGPFKQNVKGLMDFTLATQLDAPDHEFMWDDGEQEQDPLTKSQINVAYVGAGIVTINEVRVEIGREPVPWGDGPASRAKPGATNAEGEPTATPDPPAA